MKFSIFASDKNYPFTASASFYNEMEDQVHHLPIPNWSGECIPG